MKKITYTIGFAFAVLASSNAVAQQGFGTNRPDKSAAVEIRSTNKGLLVPRVILTDLTSTTTPVNNPANSLLIYNVGNADSGTTKALTAGYYYFSEPKKRWIPILDGEKIANGNGTLINFDSNTGITKVDLGGTLTKKVEIVTSDSNTFALQGLKRITDLTDKNVLISDTKTGVVEIVTVEDLLGSKTTNKLDHDTSSLNIMYSTVNGVADTSTIILTNELSIPSSADTATNTSIISKVNGVESDPINLKDIIKAGETRYEVLSSDSSVIVTPTQGNDLVTYDISVAATQAKNGLSMDTATGAVVLGGKLDRNTVINLDSNTLALSGLETDTSTSNYMVVVDGNGVLKQAQIGSNNAVLYISDSATYDIVMTDETIIVNTDSRSVTLTLPGAYDGNKGKRFYIKKTGTNETNTLTITSVGQNAKIDGLGVATTAGGPIESTLPYQSWIFQSAGTEGWFIVGQ